MSQTKHKEGCKRVFKRYDMTCPRCRELANGAKARPGWGSHRYQPTYAFADVYCTCGKSELWHGRCPSCGKTVYTD